MSPWKRFDEALHDLLRVAERQDNPELLKLAEKAREEFRHADNLWHECMEEDVGSVPCTSVAVGIALAELESREATKH